MKKDAPVWENYKSTPEAGTLRDALEYAADSNNAAVTCEDDRARIRKTQERQAP